MKPGARNLITDVAGLKVGHAQHQGLKSGTTVLVGDAPFVASVHVMGGAPGTRETDLLAPENSVEKIDALVLSGGSAFGLDAATGVVASLRAEGRGFQVHGQVVPIVPAAIIFDLANGGDKAWGKSPYAMLGSEALDAASEDFALGTAGAGTGASVSGLKGGVGSASFVLESGHTVAALVIANAMGQVTVGGSAHFWAAPFEQNGEFGGQGPSPDAGQLGMAQAKPHPGAHTTIAIVATDATLTKAQAKRMAVAAHDGIARACMPAHTPWDGDLVFGVSTGALPLADPVVDPVQIGHAGALCLARAIGRAVYEATPHPGDLQPTWKSKYGSAQ